MLSAVLWLPGLVRAQSGSAAPSAPRKTSTPYTGDLSIFDVPGRDERLQVNRVMDMLGIEPGKNVADIGAGSGWFTVRAARRVTGSGRVYAVDINPEAIQYIDQRAKKEQLQNIKTILSKPDDAQLPADRIDAVMLLKTYHEVAHPVVLLRNLRSSLKPGAKIGIIDHNDNGLPEKLVLYCGRHDYGTRALRGAGNLAVVMHTMGHGIPSTAMKYQHPELEQVRRVLNGDKQRHNPEQGLNGRILRHSN